jgi:antitoxin FitA
MEAFGMAQILVRGVDDDVKERLKARAKKHGRSLEAEARAILADAAKDRRPPDRPREKKKGFGTLMHERFKNSGLTKEEARLFQQGIDDLNANWKLRTPKFEE